MRTFLRLKIVPNNQPNADGEWIERDTVAVISQGNGWTAQERSIRHLVPNGFHCVSVELLPGN